MAPPPTIGPTTFFGRNRDLWQDVFDEQRKLAEQGIKDRSVVKVKSHVTNDDDWAKYNMDS